MIGLYPFFKNFSLATLLALPIAKEFYDGRIYLRCALRLAGEYVLP